MVIGIVPLIIFSLVLLNVYRTRSISQRISEIQVRGNVISNLIVGSGYLTAEGEQSERVDTELSQVSDMYDGRILIIDSKLKVVRDTYGLEEGGVVIIPEVIQCFRGNTTQIVNQHKNNVEVYLPVDSADHKSVYGVIVMNFSFQSIQSLFDNIQTVCISIILLIAVIIIVVSWLYTGKLVKPLKKMVASIRHIESGDFSEQIDIRDNMEVEQISSAINSMLSKVQNLEDSRQEFVSNVSHELKTPITSIKVLVESLMMQEDTPVELYREFMGDINQELDRMNKIVNDLLSLVKMDKSAVQMYIEEVNINEFIEGILKGITPIASQRNIEIIFESVRPVSAQIDSVKLGMAFTNIIENAVKYNFDNGWVRVTLNADHKFFYLRVADSGVGIPEELQDHIFERFYRVDKARSRETGGNGLGLAITRNAILLHRGSIKVHSVEKQGTTFAVRIPLIYQAKGGDLS
ncbi:MAG: HAMP domain-containing sensor histidine kinase [Clostridiales bacterium]|nr:HAMP domain-containing sensor histidine kinase [Clostridiales bacterium]